MRVEYARRWRAPWCIEGAHDMLAKFVRVERMETRVGGRRTTRTNPARVARAEPQAKPVQLQIIQASTEDKILRVMHDCNMKWYP